MRDTIEMAREAGFESNGPMVVVRHSSTGSWVGVTKEIERLIAMARADEREACAKVCENWTQTPETTGMELALCAAAIRARGKTK
jgi:lipopolysaccharide biosynthesis protein